MQICDFLRWGEWWEEGCDYATDFKKAVES